MKKIVIANWKMNGDFSLLKSLQASLLSVHDKSECEFILCPPFTLLGEAKKTMGDFAHIGAQNCSAFPSGAHTGEVSCKMLSDIGCSFVIIGHSERRTKYSESNDFIKSKIKLALEYDLRPIVCFGETLEQYKSCETEEILCSQLDFLQDDSIKSMMDNILFAYEPIWAIGTGLTPTLDEIHKVHSFLYKKFGFMGIYGGSVNHDNYKSILNTENVSGVLIGGESLKIDKITKILINE